MLPPHAVRFPPALFLDHDLFRSSYLEFPPANLEVPDYVLAEIGDLGQRRLIASQFFSTVHLWMPIVSRSLFLNTLLDPLGMNHADMALLCLAMKLIMWTPSSSNPDPHTTTYITARQFLQSCDISTTLTLPTLQASILMATYEVGHAVYPAAHFSVGACANYAIALGLGWESPSCGESNGSWIKTEERRRVWWAVVILERYIRQVLWFLSFSPSYSRSVISCP